MGDKVTALLEKTIMLHLEEDDSAINMGEEGEPKKYPIVRVKPSRVV